MKGENNRKEFEQKSECQIRKFRRGKDRGPLFVPRQQLLPLLLLLSAIVHVSAWDEKDSIPVRLGYSWVRLSKLPF